MNEVGMTDLAPEERHVDALLRAVLPVAPPIGFRDAVMRRITADERRTAWEWIVATALALPSLLFLVWELTAYGADLGEAIDNAMDAAEQSPAQAFFFVDGTVVLAVALLGLASIVATHALLRASGPRTVAR